MDYEIVHAAGATPFSNECSGGIYVAATGFSGIPRLILNAGTFPLSWLYRFARGFSCSLFFGPADPISLKTLHWSVFRALDVPVPFILPFAYP